MSAYKAFHERSIKDPEGFWAEQAKLVEWQKPFDKVLDYNNPPFAKWYVGGKINLCHNAVDRHLKDRGDQQALISVSTETEQEKTYTFKELHTEVNRMAAILKANGVVKGDSRFNLHADWLTEAVRFCVCWLVLVLVQFTLWCSVALLHTAWLQESMMQNQRW